MHVARLFHIQHCVHGVCQLQEYQICHQAARVTLKPPCKPRPPDQLITLSTNRLPPLAQMNALQACPETPAACERRPPTP